MVDFVILVCEFLGPVAAVVIGFTLLGIALDKVRV